MGHARALVRHYQAPLSVYSLETGEAVVQPMKVPPPPSSVLCAIVAVSRVNIVTTVPELVAQVSSALAVA
jgi:hypothetical protein